ncbi:MAG: thiamine diphosphokinase [Lachnospiraceae bacterium]|nr:thiamine diphosphokinase [Lachnospiraceae bacterium]
MKCVIVCGADISNYERAASYIEEKDFVIYCDSGLYHMEGLHVKPSLILGDFDSHENPNLSVETIVLPVEKDDTDSVFALKEGMKRGFDEFVLLGAVGNRFDHTFANIGCLLMLDKNGKKGMIVDDYSEMEVVHNEAEVEDRFSYFSLLNISGEAYEISISDAKYPMDHQSIESEYQYAVSNEVLPGKVAKITVHKGRVLLVKDF